ncbi:MAG: hypothetical protein JWR80_10123 [Bradyrhizobium sp.]|nr:hypothetical protein [Bradyrhizobium sp.]
MRLLPTLDRHASVSNAIHALDGARAFRTET